MTHPIPARLRSIPLAFALASACGPLPPPNTDPGQKEPPTAPPLATEPVQEDVCYLRTDDPAATICLHLQDPEAVALSASAARCEPVERRPVEIIGGRNNFTRDGCQTDVRYSGRAGTSDDSDPRSELKVAEGATCSGDPCSLGGVYRRLPEFKVYPEQLAGCEELLAFLHACKDNDEFLAGVAGGSELPPAEISTWIGSSLGTEADRRRYCVGFSIEQQPGYGQQLVRAESQKTLLQAADNSCGALGTAAAKSGFQQFLGLE